MPAAGSRRIQRLASHCAISNFNHRVSGVISLEAHAATTHFHAKTHACLEPNRPRSDVFPMNISSSANTSLINYASAEGSTARQDYSVAVAVKINDQVKQEGEAAVKLIESTPAPATDETKGTRLNTYA
jgi:hypothetical protein